jgi:hypothetical protein
LYPCPGAPVTAARTVRRARRRGGRRRRLGRAHRSLDRTKEGGIWAVGRAVNPQYRPSSEPRPEDYFFEGYELQDALDAANNALEDDASVAELDGSTARHQPFKRSEILGPLERWFFGRT